jgi:hypothetical protein
MISATTGIDAMYWNPAGLSLMTQKTEILASHLSILHIDINYFAAAVTLVKT